jgi:hypothetical protein
MIDQQGKLWVTDFGLARIDSDASLTHSGDLLGTLRYMSPEQTEGDGAFLDHRTDIYSLGVTLYELVTSQPAFPGKDSTLVLRQIAEVEPAAPRRLDPSIPIDLETIIVKSISKSPADRYGRAGDLADDLRRFVARQPIQARPVGRLARAWRWYKRSPVVAGLLTTVVLLALIVALGGVMFGYRESTHRSQAEEAAEEAHWQQYISDMHSAMAAWEDSNVGRTLELLERHRPAPGEPDLRRFEWNYLWRQCHDKRLTLTINETSIVFGVSFSHDDRRLATGNREGLVRIWDTTSGWLVDEYQAHEMHVRQVAFSPDDRIVASGDADGTIRLWDVNQSRSLHTMTGHKNQILALLFSADGKQLASSGDDTTIRLWDVATGHEVRKISPQMPRPDANDTHAAMDWQPPMGLGNGWHTAAV